MSSPPPGGSQAPQSPPTYAAQPPYPPQYPPQQPYAPPAAPPPKKSNTLLIVVLVVVIVIVVLAVIAWYAITLLFRPVTNPQSISITAVSFSIGYATSNHFFGATPYTTCAACPLHLSITTTATYTLSLTNVDTVEHNITGVSISTLQFYLFNANPNPTTSNPVSVLPGGTGTITLTIGATGLAGTTLSGTVSVN